MANPLINTGGRCIGNIHVHHRDPSSSDVKIHEFLGGLKEKPYFCNIQNI